MLKSSAAVSGILASLASPAIANPSPADPGREFNQQLDRIGNAGQETRKEKQDKKFDLLIVPIPQSSPSLGHGLTLVAGVFYNPNGSPEPWTTGVGIMRTSNKSWAVGAAHKMSLADDRFRLAAFAGYADVNVKFYGIGPNAGDRDRSIQINDRGFAALLQGQMRVAPSVYIGPRFEYLKLNSSVRRDDPLFPDTEIPEPAFKSRMSAVGMVFNYDRRDNSMNPRDGELIAATAMFNLKALGSDFSHRKYGLSGNIYRPLGKSTVIAARASVCSVSKGGPFYDLCLYGTSADLRGYEAGRYRDRASWAAQVELRQKLFGRFGAVAFAGVGESLEKLGNIGDGRFLPAGGIGLRFHPSKQTPINLRVDYAIGKDSKALYISVGEAF